MDARPVGVFDSGMGGLTVLHELLVTLPHEDFVYLGDGARLPYGPRPLPEIRRFAQEIGGWLETQGVKLIVVACNAATSAALPDLQSELGLPVVGVITPEAHAAVQSTRNRRIGLLATEATVTAGRYAALIGTLDAGVEVFQVACPALVPLIESDDPYGAATVDAVRGYAEPLQELVFSAEETAREVAETLARKGIENAATRDGTYRFLTTGGRATFRAMGARFLQLPIAEVEHVTIAELEAAA